MGPEKPNPAKVLLRNEVTAKIAALSDEEKERQSRIVYEKIINHPWYKSSSRIALYLSTENEIDTAPLIKHIQARGAAAFVPQYYLAGGIMRMLLLESGDEFQRREDQSVDEALETGGLDLLIVPGLAFSRSGDRLGHGGGYYDRYITDLKLTSKTLPKVVAVAFNCQVVDDVPTNEKDQKVDGVIYPE